MATIDPRRIADQKDAWVTALYAKTVGETDDDDALPLIIDSNGYLLVNLTTGTVSLSSTLVTISPQAGTSLATTKVTVDNTVTTSFSNSGVTVSIGRSLSSSSGTVTATQVTLVLAGSNKTKVYAFSLTTTSTTGVIASFMHGSQSGPELWRVLLQAPSGANSGANLAVSPPTWLFATPSAGNLILFLSTSVRVDYSIAWFDEA